MKNIIKVLLFIGLFQAMIFASRHIKNDVLWKHVVTLDRLAWQERENEKKVNQRISDEHFVRRIYLDTVGRVPSYLELNEFLKSKSINKRQDLIEKLLDSPGYVANFTNFWSDLLRIEPEKRMHSTLLIRYIEKFLKENKPYDQIVKDFIVSEGSPLDNKAVTFYTRDNKTGVMDTTNAAVRAFLGTRIGCAQCHNHRFDKWTQKEFYETTSFLWGVKYYKIVSKSVPEFNDNYYPLIINKREHKDLKSYYTDFFMYRVDKYTGIKYDDKDILTYPENYAYSNAKPESKVKSKIVFDYGNQKVEGETRKEKFANWIASKDNLVFSKVMSNRLWKRIMGVALMEPVDDWKDDLEIQNPTLYHGLGEIFIKVNYDFKAFLSIIFNSDAYQLAYDTKNDITQDNYHTQGASLKRMSFNQLYDSLQLLKYGNIDDYSRMDTENFELEEKIYALQSEYIKKIEGLAKAFEKEYPLKKDRKNAPVQTEILELMEYYLLKVKELEEYYNIDKNGYIKNKKRTLVAISEEESVAKNSMMSTNSNGSMMLDQNSYSKNYVIRAHESIDEFQEVFGRTDRSSPDTDIDDSATIKQILTLMNSPIVKSVANSKKSHLMKTALQQKGFKETINYFYYSVLSRKATPKEISLAEDYLGKSPSDQLWEKYTLALLNSTEFLFIQ